MCIYLYINAFVGHACLGHENVCIRSPGCIGLGCAQHDLWMEAANDPQIRMYKQHGDLQHRQQLWPTDHGDRSICHIKRKKKSYGPLSLGLGCLSFVSRHRWVSWYPCKIFSHIASKYEFNSIIASILTQNSLTFRCWTPLIVRTRKNNVHCQ